MLDVIDTKRLNGYMVTEDDRDVVREILNENISLISLFSENTDIENMTFSIIQYTDLPPGGEKQNLHSFILSRKSDGKSVGLLSGYFGYPEKEIFYLGSLFIRRGEQRRGLGKEIVEELERILPEYGFKQGRLGVALRNWGALRFWIELGYDRVTKISGDLEYGKGKYALLELAKDWTLD